MIYYTFPVKFTIVSYLLNNDIDVCYSEYYPNHFFKIYNFYDENG